MDAGIIVVTRTPVRQSEASMKKRYRRTLRKLEKLPRRQRRDVWRTLRLLVNGLRAHTSAKQNP